MIDWGALFIYGLFMGFLGGFFLSIPKWGNLISIALIAGFVTYGVFDPTFWATPPQWTWQQTTVFVAGNILGYTGGKITIKEVWRDFNLG